MFTAVVGCTGLGRVHGVAGDRPAALLEAVAERTPEPILVLTSRHHAEAAHEQARLVAAARPQTTIAVRSSDHHALTLALVADQVLDDREAYEPNALTARIERELARARSLVWYPRALWLRGLGPLLTHRLRSLGRAPGYLLELGSPPTLTPAAQGWPVSEGERLYLTGAATELLRRQLAGRPPTSVHTIVERSSQHLPAAARLLSVLPDARDLGRPAPGSSTESEAA